MGLKVLRTALTNVVFYFQYSYHYWTGDWWCSISDQFDHLYMLYLLLLQE